MQNAVRPGPNLTSGIFCGIRCQSLRSQMMPLFRCQSYECHFMTSQLMLAFAAFAWFDWSTLLARSDNNCREQHHSPRSHCEFVYTLQPRRYIKGETAPRSADEKWCSVDDVKWRFATKSRVLMLPNINLTRLSSQTRWRQIYVINRIPAEHVGGMGMTTACL